MASTHCASTNSDLLMAELSTRRSLLLSVRRLSSEPARSIQDARLTRTVVSVVCVILTQSTACDREECALSCNRVSYRLKVLGRMRSYFCCRSRTVHVRLIIQLFELLQRCTWLLGQSNNNSLAVIVANWKSRGRALLWWFKQVVYAIAVDFEVLQRDLDLCCTSRVFFNLLTPPVYGAQESRNHTTIGQRLAASHCVCLAGAGAAMSKDG